MHRMHHFQPHKSVPAIIGFSILGVVVAAAMALLFGFIVMWLWNWLMPELFGLSVITFWQAWGLVVLSHILFKSFPHGQHHSHHHDDEWKEKFRERFSKKCGHYDPAEAEANVEENNSDTGETLKD